MTDFIHEHPTDGRDSPPSTAHTEPPMDEKTGQKRVYGYIFILFLVAFGLLLWAFLMNQRSTDQALTELRGNADALQAAITRNIELEKQVDALESECDELKQEAERQAQESARQEQAMAEEHDRAAVRGLLWLLEYRYARGEYELCRALCGEIEPLRGALQTEADEGSPSELARYEELAAALAGNGG